jgi:hypothetical protein
MEEFTYFVFGRGERFSALGRSPVDAAEGLAVALFGRSEIAPLFEGLEQRIHAAGTDAVSVMREFFDHSETEDGTLHRVMQDVETDQARVQVAIGFRFRHPITNDHITDGEKSRAR